MVTSRSIMRLINIAPELAKKTNTNEAVVKKVLKAVNKDIIERRRQSPPPPPKGGISLMGAQRKYKVDHTLLSRWRRRGIIKTLVETRNEVYVSEDSVSKAVEIYKKSPGRGRRDVIKLLSPSEESPM